MELFGLSMPNAKSKWRVTEVKYKSFDIDDNLKRGNKETVAIFNELEKAILEFGEAIEEIPTKFYIIYWNNIILSKSRVRKSKLQISVYTKAFTLNDLRKLAEPFHKGWEGSTEYYFFQFQNQKT